MQNVERLGNMGGVAVSGNILTVAGLNSGVWIYRKNQEDRRVYSQQIVMEEQFAFIGSLEFKNGRSLIGNAWS